MKVTIDARFYGLENAGLGRYTMNLLHSLEEIDSENSYSVLLRNKYFLELKFKKNFKKVLADIPHYSVAEQLKLPKIIAATNPDIVHFLHFNVPRTYNKKYIVTIHDLLMHKSTGRDATTLPMFLYQLKRIGYKAIFKHAVAASQKIIVPTNFVKQELAHEYFLDNKKIEVIYEGIEQKQVSKKTLTLGNYFIYTGNAYPHKNLNRAIAAIVAVNKNQSEKIQLFIVSSRGVFTKRLEKVIKQANAEQLVKLLGFVPDEELRSLYKNSLGFLYPSLSEGFGLPALEAMKSGTLALVSDIPVFKEVYADSAFYFNPYKVSSIKKALEKVMQMDPKKRALHISNGQEYIKKYSWEKMARQTLALYERLAA